MGADTFRHWSSMTARVNPTSSSVDKLQINIYGCKQMKRLSGSVRYQEYLVLLLIWHENQAESTVISSPSSNLNRSNYRHQGVFGWIHSLHIRAHPLHNSQEMGCAVQLDRTKIFFFFFFGVASQKLKALLRCTSFHESLCRLSKMK